MSEHQEVNQTQIERDLPAVSNNNADDDARVFKRISGVFLDENLVHYERELQVLRMLQYHLEAKMSDARLRGGLSIPAKFLNPDGTVLENEWRDYRRSKEVEHEQSQRAEFAFKRKTKH